MLQMMNRNYALRGRSYNQRTAKIKPDRLPFNG
jgi:hypothetical protein